MDSNHQNNILRKTTSTFHMNQFWTSKTVYYQQQFNSSSSNSIHLDPNPAQQLNMCIELALMLMQPHSVARDKLLPLICLSTHSSLVLISSNIWHSTHNQATRFHSWLPSQRLPLLHWLKTVILGRTFNLFADFPHHTISLPNFPKFTHQGLAHLSVAGLAN